MKRILVPTDFSEEAENALKVAAELARKYGSEIFLLHILELPLDLVDPVMGDRSNDLPEAIFFMKLAHKRFDDIMTQPYLEGIEVTEKVLFNKTFEGIIETSKECGCELIVMGSKGASGFKDMFIGSNTEKVVRISETPVLVIKNHYPNFRVRNFVFATDFDSEAKKILPQAIRVAEMLRTKLHLLYVNTANRFLTSEKTEHQMAEYLKDSGFSNYTLNVFNDNSVEQGIINFSKKINAGLIGIGTHGRSGIARFFNGSISEDLVNHARRPVITFKL